MYNKLFFSELFQSNMFEVSAKSNPFGQAVEGSQNKTFSDFLRKYQENDFEFLNAAGSSEVSGDLNTMFASKESKEELIGLVVQKMKNVLRQAADNSAFVNFNTDEIKSFRQILVSMESFSGADVESIIEGMESSSGKYLPNMLSSLENFEVQKGDIKNIHFPFSFIPYFETALQSAGLDASTIKDTVEPAVDLEKGLSLESLVSSLKSVKSKLESKLSELKGEDLEKADSQIKGIEVILSVFQPPEDSSADLVSFDKKALERFLSSMEKKLESNSNHNLFYNDILLSSASKKESEFVQSLLENRFGQTSFQESFLAWKNRKRSDAQNNGLLANKDFNSEEIAKNVQEKLNSVLASHAETEYFGSDFHKNLRKEFGLFENDFTDLEPSTPFEKKVLDFFREANTADSVVKQSVFGNTDSEKILAKHFEKSHEYGLFTKLSSVELDYQNYFSDGDKNLDSLNMKDLLKSVKAGLDNNVLKNSGAESKQTSSKDIDNLFGSNLKKSLTDHKKEGLAELTEKPGEGKGLSSQSSSSASQSSESTFRKNVMNQIEKQIIRTARLNTKELSFRLNPPDLGKLHLKLENVRNGLNIKIIAEKSSTHELLVMQAQEFKHQLQSQGMQVAEVNVELAQNFDQAMARERKNGSGQQNKDSKLAGNRKSGKSVGSIDGGVNVKSSVLSSDSGLNLIA